MQVASRHQIRDYEWFNRRHERIERRLVYLEKRRTGSSATFCKKIVRARMVEFFQCKTSKDVDDFLSYWDELSQQELNLISRFAPINCNQPFTDRLKRFYDGFAPGEYNVYKEPVIRDMGDGNVITENRYEAQVLNTTSMMIVDVDLIGDDAIAHSEEFAIKVLQLKASEDPTESWRIYRTKNGLRYICTSHEANPRSEYSDRLMALLYTDAKYRNLCRFQETYRARLTPKPWRTDDFESMHFIESLAIAIEDKTKCYKACEFLMTIGSSDVLPKFLPLLDVHDKTTGAIDWRGELA